jgi:transposase
MSLTPSMLFSEIDSLRSEVTGLKLALASKEERLKHYEDEVSYLNEVIQKLKREAFGPKRERWESQEQSVFVFNEAEDLGQKPEDETSESSSDQAAATPQPRQRGKRKPLPKELPREIQVVELPEEERVAEDGTQLKPIGKEVSEKLVYEPSVMKVIEIHRVKYGVDSGEAIKTAPPPPSIIPKGIPTSSLLAHIILQKYAYGLPLYRQEEIFARLGVEVPRCTMARWIVQAAEACRPVWNVLSDRLLASYYVACDETPTQVLKERGRVAESKSWMWVLTTPSDERKIVLFDYDPSRSGEVAKRLLGDYKGTLQCDGYGAYNQLETQEELVRIGCNMHGRRKFFDAAKGSKEGQTLAEAGLKFYQRLYAVETKAKGLSWEARHALRQKESVPIWDEFKAWVDKHEKKVPPKSKIGQAFHYFLGEYEYLRGYLADGRLEMDNGFAERAIKYFAIGRKNWLFADSEAGANASALFYSFVVTAKLNGLDPYEILKQVFDQVPLAKSIDDFERLADLIVARPAAA